MYDYYKTRPKEAIEIIRDILTPEQYEGWLLGTTLKYLLRYPHKGDAEGDLAKASCYITHLLLNNSTEGGTINDR